MCPAENLFLARAAKKYPKNMPAKFQGGAIFVPGAFSKRRSLNDDGNTFFFPEVFPWPPSLESLAVAMNFRHAHAIRWRFSCSQAQKVGHLSLSPRRGPVHDRDVDVHICRKSVFLASKALVTSFFADLFLCDSSLFSV